MSTFTSHASLFRHAGAWLPLAMSCAAFALVVIFANVAENGAAPHVLQALMVLQAPLMLVFAWNQRARADEVASVLSFQAMAWLLAAIAVLWFNL